MSQSRDLQLHIAQLEEIRTILNAMKSMAFLELHKLARYHGLQGKAVAIIEEAADDFLGFYPVQTSRNREVNQICIVLGSERGFCGDFNESLLKIAASESYSGLIVIGSRLAGRLSGLEIPVIAHLPGVSTAEEVPAIINQLLNVINDHVGKTEAADEGELAIKLAVIHHAEAGAPVSQRQLLPPFSAPSRRRASGHSPVLNLSPETFYRELVHHYLFAVLHEVFYVSLIAENQSRLKHLEGAVRHLDEETAGLNRKWQMHRQEEITEEIEVILLNAGDL